MRNTWRQALCLLHLQVRRLKIDGTEVGRLYVFAVGHELEKGVCGYGYGELRERLVTHKPWQR